MPTLQEQLEQSVQKYNENADKVHNFINGDESSTIPSQTGVKPTLAKIVKDTKDAIANSMTELNAKVTEILQIKTSVESLKTEITNLKTEAEGMIETFETTHLPQINESIKQLEEKTKRVIIEEGVDLNTLDSTGRYQLTIGNTNTPIDFVNHGVLDVWRNPTNKETQQTFRIPNGNRIFMRSRSFDATDDDWSGWVEQVQLIYSSKNGDNWVKKYSDGTIEQGGYFRLKQDYNHPNAYGFQRDTYFSTYISFNLNFTKVQNVQATPCLYRWYREREQNAQYADGSIAITAIENSKFKVTLKRFDKDTGSQAARIYWRAVGY